MMLSQDSKEKMRLWLGLWPDSCHPEDGKRMKNFIKSLKANDETVDFDDLYNCYREVKPKLNEEVAEDRCRRWAEEIEHILPLS